MKLNQHTQTNLNLLINVLKNSDNVFLQGQAVNQFINTIDHGIANGLYHFDHMDFEQSQHIPNFNLMMGEYTLLHIAGIIGNNYFLERLKEQFNLDLNTTNNMGYSILDAVADSGSLEAFKYLCENGVVLNNNKLSEIGNKVMFSGKCDILYYLFQEKGLTINLLNIEGYNPLHAAAYANHLDLAKYLVLNKIIDVNFYGNYRESAASNAVQSGSVEVLKFFLNNGFNNYYINDLIKLIEASYNLTKQKIKDVIYEKWFDIHITANQMDKAIELFNKLDVNSLSKDVLEKALARAINSKVFDFAEILINQHNVELDPSQIFSFNEIEVRNFFSKHNPKSNLTFTTLANQNYDNEIMPGLIEYVLSFNNTNQGNHILQPFLEKFGHNFLHSFKETVTLRLDQALTKFGFKHVFKYKDTKTNHEFILSTQNCKKELNERNTNDIKENAKTYFQDGKIYYAKTNELVSDGIELLYVICKHGKLHIPTVNNINHSYVVKGKFGDELYGFGKAVACAGHLHIKDGKITQINNSSGHYNPNKDQLIIATKYLADCGVLDNNLNLNGFGLNGTYSLDNLEVLNIGEILEHYDELPN